MNLEKYLNADVQGLSDLKSFIHLQTSTAESLKFGND